MSNYQKALHLTDLKLRELEAGTQSITKVKPQILVIILFGGPNP